MMSEDFSPLGKHRGPMLEADVELTCQRCQRPFVFARGEQQFAAQKGFDTTPKRCQACRFAAKESRKQRAQVRRSPALHHARCGLCGTNTMLSFRPAAGRFVYCSDCFSARQKQDSNWIHRERMSHARVD
jgi:CxxC-x17-CxxC domain-containing protein